MTSKFKSGDKVVYITTDDHRYGKLCTVKIPGEQVYVKFENGRFSDGPYWEYRFVLEEVFNSPLFRAMSED